MRGVSGNAPRSFRMRLPLVVWRWRFWCLVGVFALLLFPDRATPLSSLPLPSPPPVPDASRLVVLGGTGKIGTAVAAHLSHRLSEESRADCEIVLVGRRPESLEPALAEVRELLALYPAASHSQASSPSPKITFACVSDIWEAGALDALLLGKSNGNIDNGSALPVSCVIHTAGPYADRSGPVVLDACIDCKIPVYVDVSDPLDFLEDSLSRHESAVASGTTAILAAGAFPGMSNVLAMEAASRGGAKLGTTGGSDGTNPTTVKDVRFNYFTKGLGGSGTINLYITNIGFGDPMVMHDKGKRTKFEDLSGRLLGKVDFFINEDNNEAGAPPSWKQDNARAKERVGTQKVFAWPFPEAATVASELSVRGSSSSAMGTAPDLWNDMLGFLVDLVPRNWWRSRKFSKFLADFSQPLVLATDGVMRKLSSSMEKGDCGETHAMRVDVVTETADAATGETTETLVSIVQCHDSFRRCVGQSCAEFALDAWLFQNKDVASPGASVGTGVYLPEQRYREAVDRERIVSRLTSTPGTFCYTGPVEVASRVLATQDGTGEDEDEDEDEETTPDTIFVKKTSTPGLICNSGPIQLRLEQEPIDTEEEDYVGGDLTADTPPSSQQELPVYPTEVREIVRAMDNRPR